MVYLMAATALAFALNAEPAPKPYGPAVEAQSDEMRAASASTKAPQAHKTSQPQNEDKNRAFACVDDDCKTVSPVYNTRTPAEADERPFRASW